MNRLTEAQRLAGVTALIYFAAGAVWILLSDKLLAIIVEDLAKVQEFQTVKGWFFVLATGALLYLTLKTHLTRKKELEKQLLRAQRMESLGRLAGGIAHDLNNILGPVLLGSEVLGKTAQDERAKKMLSVIRQSAERGRGLVRQILAFARGADDDLTEVRLKYVVKEVTELLFHTFPPSITVRSGIPVDLAVRADPGQIHQMLMNLAVNAKDAMPAGGELEINAEDVKIDTSSHLSQDLQPGTYIKIKVSDTGSGIPPKHLREIFQPFFTTKETGKGTGLGLSIVQSIVKNHGGYIDVESEVGKGTQFSVYLPASRSMARSEAETKTASLPVGKGETILIVDDEDSIRDIMKEALETQGYRVATARDGAEALAVLKKSPDGIEVIVTDLLMPIMDGATLLRLLKAMPMTVPVIIMSGTHEKSDARTSLEGLEYFAILEKPYSVDSLLQTVDSALLTRHDVKGSA